MWADLFASTVQTAILFGIVPGMAVFRRSTLADKSDPQLVALTLDGQQEAFGELVSRYEERIYYVVLRMVHRHEDAADIVQDAWLGAYNALDRFDPSRPWYTWLCKIAINLAINHSDKRKRRGDSSLNQIMDETGMQPKINAPASEETLEAKALARCTEIAIGKLPKKQREVFILRTYDAMSYEEIAETLGIAEGTVMSRLSRARQKLKEELAEYLEEGI